jgi:HAD superfamily hydrolase (TIGR01549 family)
LDLIRLWKERLIRKRFAGRDFISPEVYYNAFFSEMGKICYRSPKRIQNWYFKRYMPRMVRVVKKYYQPRPGAQELFQYFSSPGALRVAIFSDYPMLKERLEALSINPDQIPLYGPDSFGAQKPAVRPFLRIAETLGIAPEETLVIGDREETDGLGAFNAGMRFFCLETGRKRYFRLDPNRRREEKAPHGPQLLMYAGAWDDLIKQIMKAKI